jgi:hypothetical protein
MNRKWIGSVTGMVAGLNGWTNSWDLARRNHLMGRYEHQTTGGHRNESWSHKPWLKWPLSNSEFESWKETNSLREIHGCNWVRFEGILWPGYKILLVTQSWNIGWTTFESA